MNARRNRRLTEAARDNLQRQTLHTLITKDSPPWSVQRICLAREMGWSLSYVDRLRHNRPDEIERVAVVLNTQERWAEREQERQARRRSRL